MGRRFTAVCPTTAGLIDSELKLLKMLGHASEVDAPGDHGGELENPPAG
jgi:hypothetical protein